MDTEINPKLAGGVARPVRETKAPLPAGNGWDPFTGGERDVVFLSNLAERDVNGPDDREAISVADSSRFPLRTLVHLSIQFEGDEDPRQLAGTGTGWLAGPSTIITAGHCLLNYGFYPPRRAVSVRAVPSRNSPETPVHYLDVTPPDFRVSERWTNLLTDGTPDYEADYGAIRLPQPVGSTLHWMQAGVFATTDLDQMEIRLVGYADSPNAVPPKLSGTMWGQSGRIEVVQDSFVYYDVDTSGGQSGAPVYTVQNGQMYVVALHEAAVERLNRALRINDRVFEEISSWLV